MDKICSLCKITKNLEDFEKDKRRKDGRGSWCNQCRRTRNKLCARKYKDKRSEYGKKWYLRNRKKANQMARDNYDKEKNRIRMYNWRKNNPEKAKAAKHRRRMRKNTGRNDLSSDQIQAVFEETPFCSYCGCIKNLTLDHVKPLYRGGENTIDNILVCCGPCNSSKGTKTLWEFMDIS